LIRRNPRTFAAACAFLWLALGAACQPAPGAPAPSAQAPVAAAPAPTAGQPPAAASQPAAPARAQIEYAMVVPVVNYWLLFIAQDRGLFEQQNLAVEVTRTEQGSRAVQGLAGGSFHLAGITPDTLINGAERDPNLVMLAGELNRASYNLIVGKDVRSYADLRGQNLAIADLRDGSTVLLRKMLAANGLGPTDYDLVPVGGTGNRAAAVSNGSASGALIGQPQDFLMLAQGFPSLGLSSDVVREYQFQITAGRRDWAQQNAEALTRFLRAYVAAGRWLYDPASREAASRILAEATRVSLDDALKTYDLTVVQVQALPRQGEINVPGVQASIEAMGELGLLSEPLPPPERFMDLSYVEKAR
jgi:NitT/TauT family transport system substrate-binding protein